MVAESQYDYSTTVAILSRTAVFKQNLHPRYRSGPVALKISVASTAEATSNLTVSHGEGSPLDGDGLNGEQAVSASSSGVMHPTQHEANIYALVCPHPSIPIFVECVEDLFDTSHFLANEQHRGVQRLPVLVTQFVRAASIDRFFYTFPVLQWSVVVHVAHQVGTVLQHVHSKGVVFGDLKLPNILLGSDGHVWLVDFASAVVVHPDAARPGASTNVKLEDLSKGITYHIRAPELFSITQAGETNTSAKYPFMVDFWAFGAFLIELLTGRPCLGSFEEHSGKYTQEELQAKVLERCSLVQQRYSGVKGLHITNEVWDAMRDLLVGLMQRSPEERLGFNSGWDDILHHRFFEFVGSNFHEPFPEEYAEENDELMMGL